MAVPGSFLLPKTPKETTQPPCPTCFILPPFLSRWDIGQDADHWVVIDGKKINLKNYPHEHQERVISGPKRNYKKKQVRLIDEHGNPCSDWVNER
jgi:hypothetical protein